MERRAAHVVRLPADRASFVLAPNFRKSARGDVSSPVSRTQIIPPPLDVLIPTTQCPLRTATNR